MQLYFNEEDVRDKSDKVVGDIHQVEHWRGKKNDKYRV